MSDKEPAWQGTPQEEREANAFAMALLMPKDMVLEWVGKNKIYFKHPKTAVSKFARDFVVSEDIAMLRLVELDILTPFALT